MQKSGKPGKGSHSKKTKVLERIFPCFFANRETCLEDCGALPSIISQFLTAYTSIRLKDGPPTAAPQRLTESSAKKNCSTTHKGSWSSVVSSGACFGSATVREACGGGGGGVRLTRTPCTATGRRVLLRGGSNPIPPPSPVNAKVTGTGGTFIGHARNAFAGKGGNPDGPDAPCSLIGKPIFKRGFQQTGC